MSRFDVFEQAYSSHIFINLLNRLDDQELRSQWDTLTDEDRTALINQTYPRYPKLKDQRKLNAQKVGEYYAYRLQDPCTKYLPNFLQRILILGEDSDMADVLCLATLGAISCCLPNYSGSLLGEQVLPNLYVLMTGAAATGKGKAGLCHKLVEPLDRKYPTFIAGNSSATAMYEVLNENGGTGLIFETELDTLTQAFRVGGDFSEGLRKAFHNEKISYQRRTKHERVYIGHPVLSMVLTGTPGQVPKIMKSAENGLFSRFLFYRLSGKRESFVESSEEAMSVTGEMIADYLQAIGEEVRCLYERLLNKEHGVQFKFTKEQHERFMSHFHELSKTYEELGNRAYDWPDAGNDIEALVRRMGNICYRIMMILSIMRANEQEELPDEITCDAHDFNQILVWSELFMHHSMIHYDELLQYTGVVGDGEDEPNMDADDLMNDQQRMLWNSLPETFIKAEAISIGNQQELSLRTVEKYLSIYCELGILERVKRGSYQKIVQATEEESDENIVEN